MTSIYQAFTNITGHAPVIELVELHTRSYDEVLAVRTDSGQVIFASHPEDSELVNDG